MKTSYNFNSYRNRKDRYSSDYKNNDFYCTFKLTEYQLILENHIIV